MHSQPRHDGKQTHSGTTRAWYRSTSVWPILLSAVAIVLSQLPPVLDWFPHSRLVASVNGLVSPQSNIGVMSVEFVAQLRNTGNRNIDVSNLRLEVVYPNNKLSKRMPVSASINSQGQLFPVTTVTLKPGESWTQLLLFSPELSADERDSLARLRSGIQDSITRHLPSATIVEADAGVVQDAIKFFMREMDLQNGLYTAKLFGEDNGKDTELSTVKFALTEQNVLMINAQQQDLKYGFGVYIPVNQTKQVWVPLAQ